MMNVLGTKRKLLARSCRKLPMEVSYKFVSSLCVMLNRGREDITTQLFDCRKGYSSRLVEAVLEFKVDVSIALPGLENARKEDSIYQANLVAQWLDASTPSSVERAAGAILGASDIDISAFTDCLENRWGPLLDKVEQLTKVVDGIAEVRKCALPSSRPFNNTVTCRFIRMLKQRGRYYRLLTKCVL